MIPNFFSTVKSDCTVMYRYLVSSYVHYHKSLISNKPKNKTLEKIERVRWNEFIEPPAQRAAIRLSGAVAITYSVFLVKDVLLYSPTRPLDYIIMSVVLYIVGHDTFVIGNNLENHKLELHSEVVALTIKAGCQDRVINRTLDGTFTYSMVKFINNLIKV